MNDICKRPKCSGKIVEGVCEDCGRPPLGQSLIATNPVAVTTTSVIDEICKRAECSGKIVEGVCEDCGRPPLGKSLIANVTTAKATSLTTSSSSSYSSRSSARLGSRSTRSSRSSSRRALGAGLVSLPPLPSLDPMKSIMVHAVVPDHKRYCNSCQAKVNKEQGFCPSCGQEYSFIPTLKPNDIVANQYEVKGAIAFGGLGWIYLAWDQALSRWVVLKGLLNSKDEVSAAAAMAEKQFLAAVKHPKIVGVYNFVNLGNENYIVMEYVGGKTLKQIRQERGPLPITEAIAYILGILPAFSYLQKQRMVYCDFKLDNFMLEEEDVKLIDMGGVRHIDDLDSDIYGTKGYSAPEASQSPSFVSDLYTIARTLAVLVFDFKFQGTYEYSLPTAQEQPIFAQYDSFYRFLLKATRNNPDERFQTADEMSEQLLGVLREIVATTSDPKPAESTHFSGDVLVDVDEDGEGVTSTNYTLLPNLKVDTLDEAANAILSAATATNHMRKALFMRAVQQFPNSAEAKLRLASLLITLDNFSEAEALLKQVEDQDPFDWRVVWYQGQSLLAQGKPKEACSLFEKVYEELPGELASKLALAMSLELANDFRSAAKFYDLVSRTDPNFVSASFGLARCLRAVGDRSGAVASYKRVPASSSLYAQAQMEIARALLQPKPTVPGEQEIIQAAQAIEVLSIDNYEMYRLAAEIFIEAVKQLESKKLTAKSAVKILDRSFDLTSLRQGAEHALRECARFAKTRQMKLEIVDQANKIRPTTLF